MPGVEAARTLGSDTQVSLLSYFQDTERAAWATHGDQHDLEDRALALAVAGVKDALALAVSRVEQSQLAQRELIEGRVNALGALVDLNDRNGRERAEARRAGFESDLQRWRADHLRETDAFQRAHLREHELSQLAVDKATTALDRRLEGMNEFRAQLDRMVATLVTSGMLDVRLAALSDQQVLVRETTDKQRELLATRVAVLEQHRANQEGRFAMLGSALAALVVLVEFAFHFYKP